MCLSECARKAVRMKRREWFWLETESVVVVVVETAVTIVIIIIIRGTQCTAQ